MTVQTVKIGGLGVDIGVTLTAAAPTADLDLRIEIPLAMTPTVSEDNAVFVYASSADVPFTIEVDYSDDAGVSFSRVGLSREIIWPDFPRTFVFAAHGDHVRVRARRIAPDGELFGDATGQILASVR